MKKLHKPSLPAAIVFTSILLALLTPFAARYAGAAESFGPAPGPQGGAVFDRAEEARPLAYTVGLGKTSRISILGDRIQSAVYDQALLSVKTESSTGQLFVQPVQEAEIPLYITTESGLTVDVMLTAVAGGDPQSITLTRRGTVDPQPGSDMRSARTLAPMPVSDYEAAVKRLVRAVAEERESADILRRGACPRPSVSVLRAVERLSALSPAVTSCWSSLALRATVISLRNPRLGEVLLNEAALAGPTVLAVSFDRLRLGFKEAGSVILVEAEGE